MLSKYQPMKNEHFIHAIHNFNLTSNVILLEHAMPSLYLNRPYPSRNPSTLLIITPNLVGASSFEISKSFFEIIPLGVSGLFSDSLKWESLLIGQHFAFIWNLFKSPKFAQFWNPLVQMDLINNELVYSQRTSLLGKGLLSVNKIRFLINDFD